MEGGGSGVRGYLVEDVLLLGELSDVLEVLAGERIVSELAGQLAQRVGEEERLEHARLVRL